MARLTREEKAALRVAAAERMRRGHLPSVEAATSGAAPPPVREPVPDEAAPSPNRVNPTNMAALASPEAVAPKIPGLVDLGVRTNTSGNERADKQFRDFYDQSGAEWHVYADGTKVKTKARPQQVLHAALKAAMAQHPQQREHAALQGSPAAAPATGGMSVDEQLEANLRKARRR